MNWCSPVRYDITSGYGPRVDPLDPSRRQEHRGIDICPRAVAVAAGRVARVDVPGDGSREANGYAVWLETTTPDGRACWVGYLHLSRVHVGAGVRVAAGDSLGTIGDTGRATGVHLHWCVFVGGAAVDPTAWLALPTDPASRS